jgi:hypothetical protein
MMSSPVFSLLPLAMFKIAGQHVFVCRELPNPTDLVALAMQMLEHDKLQLGTLCHTNAPVILGTLKKIFMMPTVGHIGDDAERHS